MRYTLVREQNRNVAISVGVRPAAHNSRTCTASKEPYRACRNSASIHSCSGGGISSMVEPRTVRPPRYLGGVATLAIPKRPSLCQSHASWFRSATLPRPRPDFSFSFTTPDLSTCVTLSPSSLIYATLSSLLPLPPDRAPSIL